MYEVFFNDCLLNFGSEFNNSSKSNIGQRVELECVGDFDTLVFDIESGKYIDELQVNCVLQHNIIDKLLDKLHRIPASGGVVKNKEGKLLFIKRFGRWDLPKGKIEINESPKEAAIREVKEECNLSELKVIKPLPSTFHLYRSPYIKQENNLVLKETHWFEMLHLGHGHISPQIEEHIEDVRWFSSHELDEVYGSTYGNIKKLLDFYLD